MLGDTERERLGSGIEMVGGCLILSFRGGILRSVGGSCDKRLTGRGAGVEAKRYGCKPV